MHSQEQPGEVAPDEMGTSSHDLPKYGTFRRVTKPFGSALAAIKEALKSQGFGVLCEIDIQKAMREKLGVDFPSYVILGACNPQLAHRALQSEPSLGLLLPCNVIVRDAGVAVEIGVVDAKQMMHVVDNAALDEISQEADQRLRAALAAV